MLRRRRPSGAPGQRGAAGLLVVWLMALVITGGVGGIDAAAAIAAQGRAENAADAVAHAAAGRLAADPDRERLSVAVQADAACDTEAPPSADDGPACGRAIGEARRVAAENGAILLRLTVGPDLRDQTDDRGPGRLLTLAEVAVPRRLPVLPSWCPRRPGSTSDLCWVETWSGAQEAG